MSTPFSALLPLLAALLLSLASPTLAMPILSEATAQTLRSTTIDRFLQRRDSQGLTHSWEDMSGSSKAGVIVAPVLGAVFVLFAAFFVIQEKRRNNGKRSVLKSLSCVGRKPRGAKRLTDSPEPPMAQTQTPGGITNAGVAAG